MLKKTAQKAFRNIGALVLVCATAIPIHFAHAGGGRDPMNNTPSASSATAQKPQETMKSARKKKVSRAPNNVTTPARKQKKSRAKPRRNIETAPSGKPPAGETRFLPDEVIVRFQLSSTEQSRNRAISGLGLTHLDVETFLLSGVTVHLYQLPSGLGVRDAITRLEESAAVVNAQPNYLYVLQQDAGAGKLQQFGNDKVDLSEAHAKTKGKNTRIAVIDTAVDGSHSEFANSTIALFNVTDGDQNVDPHGTSVAGILAADTKLTGVAPEAEIISIAAFSKDASGKTVGDSWTILEALNVALKQNADILNMSFAGPADPLVQRAMEGARKRNIVPVAAAGNEGPEAATLFPAGYEDVIAVTATDDENNVYNNANTGEYIDIAAPGVDLLVLGRSSGYQTLSGTSMATAYISGIAALVMSANPGADYATIRAMLETSTTDLGAPGRDRVFGAGIPSAAVAINGLTN